MEGMALKGKYVLVWMVDDWLKLLMGSSEAPRKGKRWVVWGMCEGECPGVGIWVEVDKVKEGGVTALDPVEWRADKPLVWLIRWHWVITIKVYGEREEVKEPVVGFTKVSGGE